IVREIASLYSNFVQQRQPSLPPLALQYADYAIWQRYGLRGGLFERQVAYWKEQLSGAPAMLELPTDRSRPTVPTFRGDIFKFSLSEDLARGLYELARSRGATLFMVLLAAFQL